MATQIPLVLLSEWNKERMVKVIELGDKKRHHQTQDRIRKKNQKLRLQLMKQELKGEATQED